MKVREFIALISKEEYMDYDILSLEQDISRENIEIDEDNKVVHID